MLLTAKRRVVQFGALVLMNLNLRGIGSQWLCVPALNCHGCALAWFGCPLGMISHYAEYRMFPFLVVGILLGFGALLGRFLCGWICPFGLLQDLLHKIPFPRFRLPRAATWFKYIVLAVFVVLVPLFLTTDSPLFFCRFCPQATLQVSIPGIIASRSVDWSSVALRFSVLAVVLLMAMGNHRSFCKVFCPIGALMAVTNRFSLFGLKLDGRKCVHCNRCDDACPMDVPVEKSGTDSGPVNTHPECIDCLTCEQTCPVDAISDSLSRTTNATGQ